jgi:lipoprotein NlpI
MSTIALITIFAGGMALLPSNETDDLLKAAQSALKKGQADEALALASKAVEKDPKNARAHLLRGMVRDRVGKHADAIADFDQVLRLDPQLAEAFDERGSAYFKLGKIKESLADFDRFLELRPAERAGHWRRGIALYYAGRFDEGRKQFEAYEKVDANDVENAVWQFICAARVVGVEKARAGLLKIGHDRRVPMMVVYDLFAGKAKPEEVLAAANAGKPTAEELKPRLFYAHLYLGLYFEALGDARRAREHLDKAAKEHNLAGYMGDVARVHVRLLDAAGKR